MTDSPPQAPADLERLEKLYALRSGGLGINLGNWHGAISSAWPTILSELKRSRSGEVSEAWAVYREDGGSTFDVAWPTKAQADESASFCSFPVSVRKISFSPTEQKEPEQPTRSLTGDETAMMDEALRASAELVGTMVSDELIAHLIMLAWNHYPDGYSYGKAIGRSRAMVVDILGLSDERPLDSDARKKALNEFVANAIGPNTKQERTIEMPPVTDEQRAYLDRIASMNVYDPSAVIGGPKSSPKTAIEAVAASWASIDGRLREFGADRKGEADPNDGRYEGYMDDAAELLRRTEKRGYVLRSISDKTYADGIRKGMERAAKIPPGWKLVPVEPTDEMETAGGEAQQRSVGSWGEPGVVYRAMIAATPPSQAGGGE